MLSFDELNDEQRLELKQSILCARELNVSYGELADADELVSDEELEEEYGATVFSEDDFIGGVGC